MATKTEASPEQDWIPARLIPTAGIRGQEEQEKRAASALLAVLPAVPDFGHSLLSGMGAPKGEISTFTEVRLKDEAGKIHIPDGAIIVQRGKTRWTCLVEVKTGRAVLDGPQVARYLSMARRHDFDGLLTISNQIRAEADALPYEVDRRKVGRLTVRHRSWWRVLTEGIVQHRFRGIEDRDQAWILGELIRYLDDEKSGASGFEGMGEEWVKVRDGARNETLRAGDSEAMTIAARWEQFIEYLCLHLSQELGVEVRQHRARGKGPEERVANGAKLLATEGALRGTVRVPDAVGPMAVEANLRTGRITTSVELDAPKDGRPRTRINWLLRQLKEAPDDLRVEVRFAQRRGSRSELLGDCRENPDGLLLPNDLKREPRAFELAQSRVMGKKRGRGEGSFVSETRRQAMDFYRELVQELSPPRPKAPKLRPPAEQQQPEAVDEKSTESDARQHQEKSLRDIGDLMRFVPVDT